MAQFIELGGEFYQALLARLHDENKPKTYLEIGTLMGDTLRLSKCPSVAIDPQFQISTSVLGSKRACHFFQMESDAFFDQYDPTSILGGPIDMAFLDGLHLFEYLLRDFYNTEKHASRDGAILLHDCLPGDEHITVRDPSDPRRQQSAWPGYWTGDVWKLIPILKRWRPDLAIEVLDAPPTGIVAIRQLDPKNTVLRSNYEQIVTEFMPIELGAYGVERLHREASVTRAS